MCNIGNVTVKYKRFFKTEREATLIEFGFEVPLIKSKQPLHQKVAPERQTLITEFIPSEPKKKEKEAI